MQVHQAPREKSRHLSALEPPIRVLAQAVRPATVRSLDAIHLGTALHERQSLASFVTYDKRLLDADVTRGAHHADDREPVDEL